MSSGSCFGIRIAALRGFLVGIAGDFVDSFDRLFHGERGEMMIESAAGCDRDELESDFGKVATGEPEVLNDAEVVLVGGDDGTEWLLLGEVILPRRLHCREIVFADAFTFASPDEVAEAIEISGIDALSHGC